MTVHELRPDRSVRVFTSVGTDHHAFDRLVGWMSVWHAAHPESSGVIQHGTTPVPPAQPNVASTEYLPYDDMVATFREAHAVVCHGGPATIMDARYAGTVPIVLPRNGDRGEHVDNHQVRFTQRLAELGQIVLIETQQDLYDALDAVLADRGAYALAGADEDTLPAVLSFAQHVRALGPGNHRPPPTSTPPERGVLARVRGIQTRRRLRA